MSSGRFFTEREDSFIRSNYGTMPLGTIASSLNRSFDGVNKRVRKLGIGRRKMRRWSEAEDQVIRASAGMPIEEVSGMLGRPISSVSERWKRIGDGTSWRARSGYKPHKGRRVVAFERKNGHSVRVFEHRAVAETAQGRALSSTDIVHHIDIDKGNNADDNLYVCKGRSEHRLAHLSIERLIPELLRSGIVYFNRTKGIYELCANRK